MPLHHIFKRLLHALSNARRSIVTSSSHRLLTKSAAMIAVIAVGASACSVERDQSQTQALEQDDPWIVAQPDPDAEWLPILATQDLAVGVKRIAFSLDGLGRNEEPPMVRVSLYALDEDRESPRSVQYARFIAYDPDVKIAAHGHANASVSDRSLPIGRGVYVIPVQLTAAGLWGLLLEMSSRRSERVGTAAVLGPRAAGGAESRRASPVG